MKVNINIISAGLVLGVYFFLLGECAVSDKKEVELAKLVSVPSSYSSKIRQAYSLATSHAENIAGGSDLSPIGSVEADASESTKIFKRGRRWTSDEEELLLKLRGQRMSWAEIDPYFPERGWKAISTKYYDMVRDPSVEKPTRKTKFWTREEDELFLKLIETNASWEEIGEQLPGRTLGAIKRRYSVLIKGSRPAPESVAKQFSAEEDKLLLDLDKKGVPWKGRVKFFEDRTLSALQSRFSKITPIRSPALRKYTPEEDDLLREAIESGKSVEEISQLLGKKPLSVKRRIVRLGELGQLDPPPQTASKRSYTDAEFELMHEMRKKKMEWKDITAKYFPGRSNLALSQAYKRYMQRKEEEE